jgi:heterodisulfide reductase subunit B
LRDGVFEFLGYELSTLKSKTRPMMEANVKDASEAGAEAMVFLCPLCMRSLAKPFQ